MTMWVISLMGVASFTIIGWVVFPSPSSLFGKRAFNQDFQVAFGGAFGDVGNATASASPAGVFSGFSRW
jgi:hypothetical protein